MNGRPATLIAFMDLATLATLLKVNGLTPESNDDSIRSLLSKAGYSATEIETALVWLREKPSATKPLPVPARPQAVPQDSGIVSPINTAAPSKKGAHLFGPIALVLLALLLGVFSFTAYSRLYQLLVEGYAGNTSMQASMLLTFGLPSFIACLVIFGIALLIAKRTTKSGSRIYWVASLLAHYAVLWLALNTTVELIARYAPAVLQPIGELLGPGGWFFVGFGLAFYNASFALVALLALVIGFVSKPRENKKGRASIVIVLAILAMIYLSGVLQYPAKLFNQPFLCHGVSRAARVIAVYSCFNESAPAP